VLLLLVFVLMLMLAGVAAAAAVSSRNSLTTGRAALADQQAFWIAEAGWQRARQALTAGTWVGAEDPGTTYTESFGAGEYSVIITTNDDADEYTITSSGYVPSASAAVARRQITEGDVDATVTTGTNYALSADASASSSNGADVAANANDGDNGTKWEAGTNGSTSTSPWVALNLGSSPPSLDQMVVKEDKNVDDVTIEWSDDNSAWAVAGGLTVDESSETWTARFTEMTHRYVRARFTEPSGKKAKIKELQAYNASITLDTTNTDVTTQW
jgi:hypothetical protein